MRVKDHRLLVFLVAILLGQCAYAGEWQSGETEKSPKVYVWDPEQWTVSHTSGDMDENGRAHGDTIITWYDRKKGRHLPTLAQHYVHGYYVHDADIYTGDKFPSNEQIIHTFNDNEGTEGRHKKAYHVYGKKGENNEFIVHMKYLRVDGNGEPTRSEDYTSIVYRLDSGMWLMGVPEGQIGMNQIFVKKLPGD